MPTINEVKQSAEADTPLLFFQCTLPSGETECWSTHAITFNSQTYSARVLKHNAFELQLSGDDAMDGVSQLSITLANADSYLSQIEQQTGFKGTQLTLYFAFADLPSGTITTESTVLFRGIAGDPDEILEDALRLTFTNKLSLQRIPVPDVRISRTCPWSFPATLAQRQEALNGGANGRFSRYYRCGYSADVAGGVGNLSFGVAFTSCDGSRLQCQQRGMFSQDAQGNTTRRFGGFEFIPSAVLVRSAGSKTSHISPLIDNSAKYNDAVPLIYGTGWLKAPVDFARNDGNYTHMEVILGLGVITGVLKVVVHDVEIPLATPGQDLSATGWYNLVTPGSRNGNFNLDFADSSGNPLGDPYGSISVLSIVVPTAIASGSSIPNVQVLVEGASVDIYGADGSLQTTTFSNNPAWIILDLLRRSGWSLQELNLESFANAAQFCQTLINTTDSNGNPLQVPRYECNLLLTTRQSTASVIRGIRVSSSLMLRYGATGLLELVPETSIAVQHPVLPDGSNSTEPLNGGWPAYEFSDSSSTYSGIARLPSGAPSVRLSSRTVAETCNRLSLEFQDAFNEYQQDSLSVVHAGDASLVGYEVSSQSTALGVANISQATRVLLRQLDKSVDGNRFVQFQTSFRALKVRPGDIVALTYAKEGFVRTPLRVLKLIPSLNYELVTILGQVHDDAWYSDSIAVLESAGRQPGSAIVRPRPLVGLVEVQNSTGQFDRYDFSVSELLQSQTDGSATDTLTVGFSAPATPSASTTSLPILSLSPSFSSIGGTLPSGGYYYAVTWADSAGRESGLSFTVSAQVPAGSSNNTVTLSALSFPPAASAFNVYRGTNPQELLRVASGLSIATSFTDSGYPVMPIGPPDPNFDHANFYYRFELAGPFPVTSATATSVGWTGMGAVPLAYQARAVRIIAGTGEGQERVIATNDATTVTIATPWSTVPDSSSEFVVVENSWKFAAVSASSPIQFGLPYQKGAVIQITGRAANINNLECSQDLSPVTRQVLGGAATTSGISAAPAFTLAAPGAGLVTLSQVEFSDLTNTSSVSTGTLQLLSWNELADSAQFTLVADMDPVTGTVTLSQTGVAYVGQTLQIDTELMIVSAFSPGTSTYQVVRGSLGTTAATHSLGASVLHLDASTSVIPFALGFFENRAATNFTYTLVAPDVRISAAQLFVTNAFGDSESTTNCYTAVPDGGLRTLSGGQLSLQVASTLATQTNAAPSLVVEAPHAIRDVSAMVNQAPAGYDVAIAVLRNGAQYCSLVIPSGQTASSAVIDGASLPSLSANDVLNLNVTLNVNLQQPAVMSPGRDLTVTIRM